MTSPTTVLHISDPQFGGKHRFGDSKLDFETLAESLIVDLEKLARGEYNLHPDLIIVSGDLAEQGAPSEFDKAFNFLTELSNFLKIDRRRIVVIPGNHDLNRQASISYFSSCRSKECEPEEPYWPKWDNYAESFNRFYEGIEDINFTDKEPWTLFRIPELRVVVAGLNSTMKEWHEGNHFGYLGEKQLNWFARELSPCRDKGWLRLGTVHHNLASSDGKNLQDADKLARVLSPYLNAIFHGHIHNGELKWLARNVPIISAGSTAVAVEARPEEVPNQYQILRFSRGHLVRYARHYVPDQGRWVGDTRLSNSGNEWRENINVEFHDVKKLALHGEVEPPGTRLILPGLGPELPPCSKVAWSPDWSRLATGHSDGSLYLWKSSTGHKERLLAAGEEDIQSLSISPDSRLLASGANDGTVHAWDIKTGNLKHTSQHKSRILDVTILPRERLAITRAGTCEIEIRNLNNTEIQSIHIAAHHGITISVITFGISGQHIAAGLEDRTIQILNLGTGEIIHVPDRCKEQITSLTFDSQDRFLACGLKDGNVRIYNTKDGSLECDFDTGRNVSDLTFSPNGKHLAAVSNSGISVRSVKKNFCKFHLRDGWPATPAASFSPDGLYLASASVYHIQTWNLTLKSIDPQDTDGI